MESHISYIPIQSPDNFYILLLKILPKFSICATQTVLKNVFKFHSVTHEWRLTVVRSLYDNIIYQFLIALSLSFFIARGVFSWRLILTKFRLILILLTNVTDPFNPKAILVLVEKMVSAFLGKKIRDLLIVPIQPHYKTLLLTRLTTCSKNLGL